MGTISGIEKQDASKPIEKKNEDVERPAVTPAGGAEKQDEEPAVTSADPELEEPGDVQPLAAPVDPSAAEKENTSEEDSQELPGEKPRTISGIEKQDASKPIEKKH